MFLRSLRSRVLAAVLVLSSLASTLAAQNPGGLTGDPTGRSGKWPLVQAPIGNPFETTAPDDYVPTPGSYTEAKARLGKALFWDEQVSTDNTMACGTCHLPEMAGLDSRGPGLATNNGHGSFGVLPQDPSGSYVSGTPTHQQPRVTEVIAPTMLGSGFLVNLFWDLRAGPDFSFADGTPIVNEKGVFQFAELAALEDLVVDPPLSDVEMAHEGLEWGTGELESKIGESRILALATPSTVPEDLAELVETGATYADQFDEVFAGDPNFGSDAGFEGVTRERFALAVATYLRTLVPNQAPIDTRALTAQELAGFQHLRLSGAPNVKCFTCHASQTGVQLTGSGGFVNAMDAMLTDGRRRSNNFPSPPGATGRAIGSDPVKSPTLRNLALKPIFAHNGFFSSLDDLLAFYNREGPSNPSIFFTTGSGPQNRLTDAEKADVLAFFAALTDPRLVPSEPGARLGPPFDRPDLYSERVPFQSNEPTTHPGTPPPGTLAAPDVIVNAPALAADPHWKIGVRDAPAGATAILGVTPQPLRPPSEGPYYLVGPGLRHLVTSTDDEGFATFRLPPADATLVGTVFRAQWRVYPPGSTVPAYSNAGEVELLP